MTLQCIAVDDEPLALGLVCRFIEQTPFLNLAGRYLSAVEALRSIHSQKIGITIKVQVVQQLCTQIASDIQVASVIERNEGHVCVGSRRNLCLPITRLETLLII